MQTSKTMLTYDILDRFEKIVDPDTLTVEQILDVEYCAYCARMCYHDHESAWKWFVHLLDIRGIYLEA